MHLLTGEDCLFAVRRLSPAGLTVAAGFGVLLWGQFGCSEPPPDPCELAQAELAYIARDTFSRPDSVDLGETEVGSHPWIEPNRPGSGYIQVQDEALSLHYFADPAGSEPEQWANLGLLELADAVMDVRVRSTDDYMGGNRRIGLSYRMPIQDGSTRSRGYHVYLSDESVALYAGKHLLAEAAVADDLGWHDYRILVDGDGHCVVRDGVFVLSVHDDTYPRAGYWGVSTSYSIATFDDLGVAPLPDGRSDPAVTFDVYDDFERSDSAVLGTTSRGGQPWWEAGSAASLHVHINEGTLYAQGLSPPTRASLVSYPADSLEIVFSARGNSGYMGPGRPFGVSYRMPSHDGDMNSPGYHLRISENGIALHSGSDLLASYGASIDTAWHRYRLEVAGPSHRVFLDGELVLDLTDDTHLESGFVGLFAHNSVARFDNLGIRDFDPEPLYPAGDAFPMILLAVAPERLDEVRTLGANGVHSYTLDQASYHASASAAELPGLLRIGSQPPPLSEEQQIAEFIAQVDSLPSLGWWLIEELDHNDSDDSAELQNLFDWTRNYDPAQSPVFLYNENRASVARLEAFAPYADVIGAGAYADYIGEPRAWVRWRVESTVDAIELAGYSVGNDWLVGGEKVPVVIPASFGPTDPPTPPTDAAGVLHDIWVGIASGARGVVFFSHGQAIVEGAGDGLAGFYQAAAQLLEGGFGEVVLSGQPALGIDFTITAGPTETAEFTPRVGADPLSYPCLTVQSWVHDGGLHVLAVNSCTDPLTADLDGFPPTGAAVLPFETRIVAISAGTITDQFAPLDVHIYRIDL